MADGLRRLVHPSVVVLPIEDPHPHQTTKDRIPDLFPVAHRELLRRTDHIRPQRVIVVQFRERIPPPAFFSRNRRKTSLIGQDRPMTSPITDLWSC